MPRDPLTPNQRRGFLAAWGGWVLDGMDSFIYALVMVPALRELLPRSGIPGDQSNVGFYGGLLFALFLVGWGCSLVWGPIADRFGRVRTLMFTILCYSIFTFLGAFATSVWVLAAFRLLAGVGIGGEWSMGGTFIAEELPEARRKMAAGLMHTGYYVGIFLAAIANYFIGARYGWRAMFVVGGTPALLVGFIRFGVTESRRWEDRIAQVGGRWTMQRAFLALFSPEYRRRTLLNSTYLLISIVGLWAGSVYVPASVSQLAVKAGFAEAEGVRLASYGTMILATGTIIGCLLLPILAEKFGRRLTLAIYFAVMAVFISLGFGYVFYLPTHALTLFMIHDLFVLAWHWGRQLCDVHPLVAGTVPDRMPGQRVCFRHFDRALCRRRHHFSGGRRRRLLSHDRDAGGVDVAGFSRRPNAFALRQRDERRAAAGLGVPGRFTIHDSRFSVYYSRVFGFEQRLSQ